MKTKDLICEDCEAEFYVETDADIEFCVCCGSRFRIAGFEEDDDIDEEELPDDY